MSNNCYHYAGTIVKVLEHEYGLANSVVGDSAGKWWCGVVIFPHKKGLNSLSLLLEKFREEMKKFVSLLYQIINIYLRTLVYRNLGQWVSCVRVSRRRMQGSKSSCVSWKHPTKRDGTFFLFSFLFLFLFHFHFHFPLFPSPTDWSLRIYIWICCPCVLTFQ